MPKAPERMQLTNFEDSRMDPDRARRVQQAEDMYVNGIIDMDDEGNPLPPRWPSYGDVARACLVPVHVINEQAAKHNWVRRREIRQTRLLTFQNEQMARRWAESDRAISDVLTKNTEMLAHVLTRKVQESFRAVQLAAEEEARLIAAGNPDALVRADVKQSEIESLARSHKTLTETQKAVLERAYGLPLSPEDIPIPPEALPTADEEAALEAEALEKALPATSVLDVYREIVALEQKAMEIVGNKVIAGEVDDNE